MAPYTIRVSAYYVPLLRQHAAAVRGLPAAQRASKTAAILAAVLDAHEPPTTVAVAQACDVSQPFVCRVLAKAAADLALPRVPDARGLARTDPAVQLAERVGRALANTTYAGTGVRVARGEPLEVEVSPPAGWPENGWPAILAAVRGALGALLPDRRVGRLYVRAS